jgi:predicted N-acetyltransferase YhbS
MQRKAGPKASAKVTEPAPLRAGHILSSFDCSEEVLNFWLTKRALPALAERTASTFVVCRGKYVIGYYSLAAGSLAHADCTSSLRRNTPNPIPATVLARLAVDRREQGNGIGSHLIQDAMKRTLKAARQVAARTLIVHALTENVANYYRRLGFLDLPRTGEQVTLHLPLERIVVALKQTLPL